MANIIAKDRTEAEIVALVVPSNHTALIVREDGTPFLKRPGQTAMSLVGVSETRQILAGAGLTGGGDLSEDRTLNIVAANGSIIVNADSIQVGSISASQVSDFDTQVRTNRLNQLAAPTAAVSLNSQKITNLANGTAAQDAVNFQQLSDVVQGAAPVTLTPVGNTPNANAATLVGQALTLQTASAEFDGLMAKTQVSQLAGFFGRNVFLATDYGPLVSGIDTGFVSAGQATANTNTIKAGIAAAQSVLTKKAGGIVLLPPGTFHIDDTLRISESCVFLVGAGCYGNTDDIGTPQTGIGTSLFWNTAGSPATTPMVAVESISGAMNPAVKNSGVMGITLQCAGQVGIGLRVLSIHWGQFKDLYIVNPSSRGISAECLLTTTQLGEAADNTKCDFDRVRVRLLESPATATGFYLDGAANANTSNSTFRNTAVSCFGAQRAFDIRNTDSNSFYDTRINQSADGTVCPVILRGGTAAGLEARGNVFFYLAPGGSSAGKRGMEVEGTDTAGVVAAAKNNAVYGYSIENGEPYPIRGTGASLKFEIIGGTAPFKLASSVVADSAFTNVVNADVGSLIIPANALVVGDTFEFEVSGSVINTTAASNLLVSLLLNGAVIATVTAALGTTAVATPGRGFCAYGSFTLRAAGLMPNMVADINNLANFSSNVVTPVAFTRTNNNTIVLRVVSSAATSTGTVRQGFIAQAN